ncbi:MAG TPA: FGGY family carbohydrate kinase, partial [Balneolaceae bacterium]|nr:FGGY family carbohydrate kinase [Balneolaceae bacterium]
MQLLGYDVGSSSIKACLLDASTGNVIASAASPKTELAIQSPKKGWAEQDPEVWWHHIKKSTALILDSEAANPADIAGIGISYQMHGLVIVDEQHKVLHPAIIWCDGRAVEIGNQAFKDLGSEFCLEHYLNSPANFTASKLRWVRENKPEIFSKIHKVMLPGDYIAMKLTGDIRTSVSGLSEGILWDYQSNDIAYKLLAHYGIPAELLPEYDPNFAVTGELNKEGADELGLTSGIPIGYRAGDQPNNALSLNVLDPGEVAATAGTSGVIYGVTDKPLYDAKSRVNTFVHVNNDKGHPRYGVLLCINGTGIQNSWLKNTVFDDRYSYDQMNERAAEVPVGSEGVRVLPFGNGPERVLQNRDIGAMLRNINFNRHGDAHLMRAVQEGIAFSLNYGLQVMRQMGMSIDTIRVGSDNMFQSPLFREVFTNVTGATVELYNSNGALGAAIGAGLGASVFKDRKEAFK